MGQFGETDCRAGMLAHFRPEQLVEEIGCSVDYLRHAVEAGRGVDHAEQPYQPLDAIEIAELGLEAGEDRQRDGTRGRVAFLDGDVLANLAEMFHPGSVGKSRP